MFSSIFHRLFGKTLNDNIDRSLGFSRVQEFRDYLLNEDYQKFEQAYNLLHWSERTLLIEGCCFDDKYAKSIEQWVKNQRNSYHAHLFWGVYQTHCSWQIRTAQTADQLTATQIRQFLDLLEYALEHLQHAYELNSKDPEICARIIRVMMGLSKPEDEVERWFLLGKALETNHLQTHLNMLNYLTPKWCGSVNRMHGFTNKHYMVSDKGVLSILPLYTMVEEWLYLSMKDEKEALRTFFTEGHRRTYILQVHAKFIEFPENSLLHPIFYNYLAFLLLRIGEPEMVHAIAPNFVQGKMTEYPWAYVDINNHTELQEELRLK
jgi:hypothetical protein